MLRWLSPLLVVVAVPAFADPLGECLRSMSELRLEIWTESVNKQLRVGRPVTYLPAQNAMLITRDDRLIVATPQGEVEIKPNETACSNTTKTSNVRDRARAILEGELSSEKSLNYSVLKRNMKTAGAGYARQIFANCEKIDELKAVVAELRRVIVSGATGDAPRPTAPTSSGTAL